MKNFKIVYKGLVQENVRAFQEDYCCETEKWLETDWMLKEDVDRILEWYKNGISSVLFAYTNNYSLGDILLILEEPKIIEKKEK